MKLLSTLALFAVATSAATATITADPTTVPDVPTTVIPPVSLVSGVENYCEKIGGTRCVDKYKVMRCTEYHSWVDSFCPWGCDSDEDMKHCLGLPPSATLVPQSAGYCPTINEHRCVHHTKVEACAYDHAWAFLRNCPLGCDKGEDFTLCDSSESGTLLAVPAPSVMPEMSNVRRNDGPCTPQSRACDSERRFLFICGDNGRWDEGRQCNRANGCKIQGDDGLTCAGHPHFYYDDNRICERERSCELMAYRYCLAGDPTDPVQQARCLAQMCGMQDCRDCDRCVFHLQPGQKICPDLSTLWMSG